VLNFPISVQFGYFFKAGYFGQVWDKNDWLYEDSMGLDRDILAKVKSSQCART
jgi:hypothetical protein